MNSIPQIVDKLYWRREKDGHILAFSNTAGTKFLNPTSALIFSSIDGKNTVGDIVEILQKKYFQVDKEELKKDIIECLYSFKTLRFIKWKRDDKDMENDDNRFSVEVVGEENYSELSKFILSSFSPKADIENIVRYLPGSGKALYTDIAIRTRQFHLSELNLYSRRGQKFTSWVSITGLNTPDKPVDILGFMVSKENIEDLYYTYQSAENVAKSNGRIKMKFVAIESLLSEEIYTFLDKIGLKREAVLEKESGNDNVFVFSKFL